jgi:hypothetical protein
MNETQCYLAEYGNGCVFREMPKISIYVYTWIFIFYIKCVGYKEVILKEISLLSPTFEVLERYKEFYINNGLKYHFL